MSPLGSFLRAELAPVPGRLRATLRVVVASLVATAVVMGTQVPNGHWLIFSIFILSPEDAGASLLKSFERLVRSNAAAVSEAAPAAALAASEMPLRREVAREMRRLILALDGQPQPA